MHLVSTSIAVPRSAADLPAGVLRDGARDDGGGEPEEHGRFRVRLWGCLPRGSGTLSGCVRPGGALGHGRGVRGDRPRPCPGKRRPRRANAAAAGGPPPRSPGVRRSGPHRSRSSRPPGSRAARPPVPAEDAVEASSVEVHRMKRNRARGSFVVRRDEFATHGPASSHASRHHEIDPGSSHCWPPRVRSASLPRLSSYGQ